MKWLVACLAALVLCACVGGVKARPRVGLGMEHSDRGSFVGADLGEYGPADVSINVEPFPMKGVAIAAGIVVVTLVGVGVLLARKGK